MSDPASKTTSALAKGLGVASLGLGLGEVLAPGKVVALAGIDDTRRTRAVTRALGVRECGHGAALLAGSPKLVWTRVAGDALDIALLVTGLRRSNGHVAERSRRGTLTAVALTAIAGADLYTALRTTGGTDHSDTGRHANAPRHQTLRAAITVQRSPEEVYRFWRDLENLPSFMYHLESVTTGPEDRSHWIAKAPVGQPIRWDAQITEDVPNKRIAWQSLPGSGIQNGGCVDFAPDSSGKGTEVRVSIGYHLPGGAIAKAGATLLGESPDQQVNDDLRRFKQILETGQVVRSDGSPEGTSAFRQMHQQTAQPEGASR